MPTTARADMVAAMRAVLVARKAASPTLLRAIYNARPGSFAETPCAYIGGRDEAISYTVGTRTREFRGLSFVIADTIPDASEEADRMDVLVDLLVDDFWGAVNVGGRGLLQLTSVSDADVTLPGPNGAVIYRGAIFGFGDPANPTFIQEGGP